MVGDPTSTAGWWAPTYITPCTSSPAPTDYITCLFQQRRLPPSSAWQITSLWYVWPRPPPPAPPTASLPSCSVPAPHACMDGCAWDGLMMTSLVSPHPPCARCGWTPGCAESSLADVPGRVHYFRQCDLHVSARSGPAGGWKGGSVLELGLSCLHKGTTLGFLKKYKMFSRNNLKYIIRL